jgi:hypothetical protein
LKAGQTVKIVELKGSVKPARDQIVPAANIPKYGRVLASVPSETGKASFEAQPNTTFEVAAFAYFASEAIASNIEVVNTYLPIEITPRLVVDGDNLVFTLADIPEDALFIYYGLKDKAPYWTSPSELNSSNKVNLSVCKKRNNELAFKNADDLSGECYLTLYTEYGLNGLRALSAPLKEVIKIPILVRVQFAVKMKKGRTAAEVQINAQVAKGRAERLPDFYLATASNETIGIIRGMPFKDGTCSYRETIQGVCLAGGPVRVKLTPVDEKWLDDLAITPMKGFSGTI